MVPPPRSSRARVAVRETFRTGPEPRAFSGRRDLLAVGGDVRTGALGTGRGVGAAVAAPMAAAVGTGGEGSRTGDGESGAEHGASGGLCGHAEYTSGELLVVREREEGRR